MTHMLKALGLLLTLTLCLPTRAEEPPKPPDLKKYNAFAVRLQNLVRENKLKELEGCFDDDALIERALRDIRMPMELRNDIIKPIRKQSIAGEMFGIICKGIQQEGSYTLLRVRMVDGQPRALFRLLIHNGLNYHDLVLANNAKGEPRIVDMYIAASGEFASATMRRMARLMISGDAQHGERLKKDNDFLKNNERILRYLRNTRSGRYREALKDWAALPAAVQKEKIICLSRVLCTMGLVDEDENSYLEAMAAYRKAFPNDPSVDLMTMDHYVLTKRFTAVRQGLDRIERAFGRDAYLDVLRASTFLEESKWDDAKKAIRRAVKEEPSLQPAYWASLRISLRSRDFKDTVHWLREIEKRFKIPFDDLTEDPDCKDFVTSPEYKEWVKQRKKL